MRAALALLLFLIAAPAMAQAIRHCVDAQGHPVFTDRPCSDVQAVPQASPQVSPQATDATAGTGIAPPTLCAADFDALKQAAIEAFAARDANRLAGLMLWDGHDRRDVVADIARLAALMSHPLLAVESGAAAESASSTADRDLDEEGVAPGDLILRTAAADGGEETTRYTIVHRSGCLWLRP